MITSLPADFLILPEVKEHLNKTSTDDDTELGGFIDAAQQMIVDRIGQVSPVTAVEDLDGAQPVLLLRHRPIVSVTSVETLPGLDAVPEADEPGGVAGWVLVNPEGVLRHTSTFPTRVRVTYEAGRDPLPANIRMAGLELVHHLWESQRNDANRRPSFQQREDFPVTAGLPGAAYSLPIRVRELLNLSDRMTDQPLVG